MWENFRNAMVQLGYYQRESSWWIYLCCVTLFFGYYWYFIKKSKDINIINLSFVIAVLTFISYPFLSHDIFNYMFDAKILTFYHKNPYMFRALDFPADDWLRFMHWTHRTYPYGPTFLPITLIPSFLSMGKFLIDLIFFKLMYSGLYILTVVLLNKVSKHVAIIYALNPYIIVEGLVNMHNDALMVNLALIGIFLIFKKQEVWGRVLILLSVGIKYLTLPVMAITRSNSKLNKTVMAGTIALMIAVCFKAGILKPDIQQWYFLTILVFVMYFPDFIASLSIFFAGLLYSYYPFIRLGGWDSSEKVMLKHEIILVFLILNLIYFGWRYLNSRKRIKTA
jgi:hypothetical protein